MKNLHLWDVSVNNINLSTQENHLICYGHNDSNSGELYVCSQSLVVSSFGEIGEEIWRTELSGFVSPGNRPVNVTLLSLTNDLCVGLENGEIITIGDLGASCKTAGVSSKGLLAMEWSPDQELFALITKDMNMILMSCTFDPVYEVDLFKQEFGEKQFITVGWGKKETQFHGSEGKHAKVKTEVTADPNSVLDNSVKITWRGDGNFYAVGFTLDGVRRFKVFDREGHLQYTSEKQPGLEANLAWRPSGNVIATTQKLPNKYVVAFFEKNGLKHGGFDIPVSSSTVIEDLLWSSDSEILTLQCRDTERNTQTLLLFIMGNYHWYLKQSLEFNREQCISKIVWDNDFDVQNNKKLHVILCNGQYISYSWIWSIDHSKGKNEEDDAIIAVIDGKKLLVTGFRQTAIPPPMAALGIELGSFINSVNFAPSKTEHNVDTNSFFVTTTDNKMVFFEQTSKFPLQYKTVRTVELESYKFPFQNYNWYWLNHETFLSVRTENKSNFLIMQYNLKSDKLIEMNDESLPAAALRIESHPIDLSIAFLHLNNGDILQYSINGMIEPKDISFANLCPKFSVFLIEDNLSFVGLSHKGNLYIDDVMIMNNVNSFFVHSHFLLITTLQHILLCTELTKAGVNAIKEYSKNESTHVYKRKIERGAKLVIAVPDNTRTVFQMPRGNLETIQPRPLTLKIVGNYLDSHKFYEAFDLMRKERINLNLIYDHNPNKFIMEIKEFIETISNDSWLSLFITELENEDVTKTMYSSSYANRNDSATDRNNNNTKVLEICREIKSELFKRDYTDCRILPVLTAYVKVKDLESALLAIKHLREHEAKGDNIPVSSDEALKYLLYMVDVNSLFDAALGIYDFDLVLVIANKSQKDPKEFIPMLNEWGDMEENYKQFNINKHLKRFRTAVNCLAKCGPGKHEELRTFVKYHSLYIESLPLFKPEDEIYKQISDDFGQYLKLKKQYTEAGLVYQRGGSFEKAIECYCSALEWELAISLAQMWPKSKFQEFCWDLAQALKEEKRQKEAVSLLEQYYENKEETIVFAIANRQYKTALRLCTQLNKIYLEDENFVLALLDEHKRMQELVDTNTANFRSFRDRLRVVRENKRKNPVESYDLYENRECDLYSDAGSTLASSSRGSSNRSFRSSKNRRKHERKVASLKPGSQYEDVALVMTLHTLVSGSFELRLPARELNLMLRVFGRDEQAAGLQTSLATLLSEMKDSLKEIWTNELLLEATKATIAAEGIPDGSTAIPHGIASLEPHIRIAPVIKDMHWKLDGLTGLFI